MPQIAQQDYLEHEVDLNIVDGEDLPDSFKRAMFRHSRQGTLLDVVLVYKESQILAKARILGYDFEEGDKMLYLYFINSYIGGGSPVEWSFTEPEPEPQTEE